jgi:hypothetical protein
MGSAGMKTFDLSILPLAMVDLPIHIHRRPSRGMVRSPGLALTTGDFKVMFVRRRMTI